MITTSNAPLPWAQPYYQNFLSNANDVANAGYTPSPSTALDPNAYQTAAYDMTANRAINGSPVMSAANGQLQNIMGGAFMNQQAAAGSGGGGMNPYANQTNAYTPLDNPYLKQSVQNAQGDLVRSWNSTAKPAWDKAMQDSGSFGNSGVQEANVNAQNDLQKNLGRISTDAYNNAYNQSAQLDQQRLQNMYGAGQQAVQNQFQSGENLANRSDAMKMYGMGATMNALNMAPGFANQDYQDANALMGVGNAYQTNLQNRANQNYNWWNEANQWPVQRLGVMGNALGINSGTATSVPDPSSASSALGGAITGGQLGKLFGGTDNPQWATYGAGLGGLLGLFGG